MARKLPYYELLKDPRWQRKRLEVMDIAGFACMDCGATDKTLNVHHAYYQKNRDPWDYPFSALRCLCEDCHLARHDSLLEIQACLGQMGRRDMLICLGYVYANRALAFDNLIMDELKDYCGVRFPVDPYAFLIGVCDGIKSRIGPEISPHLAEKTAGPDGCTSITDILNAFTDEEEQEAAEHAKADPI